MNNNSRLVYSTETGRVKHSNKTGAETQGNQKNVSSKKTTKKSDGIVRIRRETSGRKGKGVTTIDGLTLSESELKTLAKQLKQACSTGGTVKDGIIEIQGDHREKIRGILIDAGYQVKLAGG